MKYKYYTAQMACRDNHTRTVLITTDATNTQTKTLTLTGCTVEMEDDEDVYAPIRGMQGKLSIQCNDDDLSIDDILPASPTAHTITITRDDNIIEFTGYLTAESSSQVYPPQGNSFDVQFVSKLKVADKVRFCPMKGTTAKITDLCPIASILEHSLRLLGYDSIMYLPLFNTTDSVDYYKNLKLPLHVLCGWEIEDMKDVYTTPEATDYFSDTKVSEVLEKIAKIFLFTICERNGNIYVTSPDRKKYIYYNINNILPNADPGRAFEDSMSVLPPSFGYGISADTSIDYRQSCNKLTVNMSMESTSSPWKTTEYGFTSNPSYLRDEVKSYGQSSLDGLMTVSGHAAIVDIDTEDVKAEKAIYWNHTADEQVTVKLSPQSFIADNYQRHVKLKFKFRRYDEKQKKWVYALGAPASFKMDGEDFDVSHIMPAATIVDDSVMDGLKLGYEWVLAEFNSRKRTSSDAQEASITTSTDSLQEYEIITGPYLGVLQFNLSFPANGIYCVILEECSMKYNGSRSFFKDVSKVEYRHLNNGYGDDYSLELPICISRGAMSEAQLNAMYNVNADGIVGSAYAVDIWNRLKAQKCTPWHTISITEVVGAPRFYRQNASGKQYMLTGMSRDYMESTDKIKLTSINL